MTEGRRNDGETENDGETVGAILCGRPGRNLENVETGKRRREMTEGAELREVKN
jgi:hypothetical protein